MLVSPMLSYKEKGVTGPPLNFAKTRRLRWWSLFFFVCLNSAAFHAVALENDYW